ARGTSAPAQPRGPSALLASADSPSSAATLASADEVDFPQLSPPGDPQLGEDVAEVVIDRPRTDEQLRRDLLVRRARGDEARDLAFLRGEGTGGVRGTAACGLAARAQLRPGPLRPRHGAQPLEGLQRVPQIRAGVDPAPLAAEELAQQELR